MSSTFYLSLFGLGQSILLCLALSFSVRKGQQAHYLFIAFLTILSLIFLRTLLLSSGVLTANPQYIGWGLWVLVTAPPLAYFYMRSAINQNYQLPKLAWLHFIPTIIGGICTVFLFTEAPAVRMDMIVMLLEGRGIIDSSWRYSFLIFQAEKIVFFVQIILYWWFTKSSLSTETLVKSATKVDSSLLVMMKIIRQLALVYVLFQTFIAFTGYFIVIDLFPIISTITHSILLLLVSSVFVHAFKCANMSISDPIVQNYSAEQVNEPAGPENFALNIKEYEQSIVIINKPDSNETAENGPAKYQKSKLSQQRITQLAEQFEAAMRKEKSFSHDGVSLPDVANHLECTPNQLSQAINTAYGKTFTELISSMRVEEAKQLLTTSPKKTVLDISFSVGFQSKSAFYKSFKKHTGLTPTSYRKSLSAQCSTITLAK